MSNLIKLLLGFLMVLISTTSFAQQQDTQYQITGTFPVTLPQGTGRNGNFTLSWNEKEGNILGRYSDDVFVGNTAVTGTVAASGRIFNIQFPQTTQGVSSLMFATNQYSLYGGTIPLMMYARDQIGNTLSQINISAVATVRTDGINTDRTCDIGFGAISGFCGLYAGTILETSDTANRCNLTAYSGFRLELATSSQVTIYLNYNDSLIGLPSHSLGSLRGTPLTSDVTISNRLCSNLAETTFLAGNCKTMVLAGNFLEQAGNRQFTGTYTITDDATNESCSYSLNLTREKQY